MVSEEGQDLCRLARLTYLYDAQQVQVLDDFKLGQGDASLLLQLLGRLQVPVLRAVLQHHHQDVAPAINQPLLFLHFQSERRQSRSTKTPSCEGKERTASRLSFCALSCINELMAAEYLEADAHGFGFEISHCFKIVRATARTPRATRMTARIQLLLSPQ
jgi:hypothetical protein